MANNNLLKSEEDVKEYLSNILIEYKFICFGENKPEVCDLLGDYYESISQSYYNAMKVYKANCLKHNWGKSCTKYGTYAYLGRGMPERNPKECYEFYKKGCDLNDPEACFRQGLLLYNREFDESIVPHDAQKAMDCFSKSCDGKYSDGCFTGANLYMAGVQQQKGKSPTGVYEVEKNPIKALKLLEKGCDLDHFFSCAHLIEMYEKGIGVAKNAEKAEELRKKALLMEARMKYQQK